MNVQILVYFLLMYADDLVLFSKIVNGLQQMLDCLFEYSQKCGMEVNIEKSNYHVKQELFMLGFGELWINQHIDDTDLPVIKQRLLDQSQQLIRS